MDRAYTSHVLLWARHRSIFHCRLQVLLGWTTVFWPSCLHPMSLHGVVRPNRPIKADLRSGSKLKIWITFGDMNSGINIKRFRFDQSRFVPGCQLLLTVWFWLGGRARDFGMLNFNSASNFFVQLVWRWQNIRFGTFAASQKKKMLIKHYSLVLQYDLFYFNKPKSRDMLYLSSLQIIISMTNLV